MRNLLKTGVCKLAIFNDIFVYPGFFIANKLPPENVSMIQKLISNQIKTICLEEKVHALADDLDEDLSNYHQSEFGKNFHYLLTKSRRLFSKNDVKLIKEFLFSIEELKLFNNAKLTNEEKQGDEEIYWRIVRPDEKGVGNIHADKWFWDLGIGQVDTSMERIKIWVGLIHDRDEGGLEFAPGSHLLNYPYSYRDDGYKKRPYLDVQESQIPNFENVGTTKGVIAVFNDRTLHRGLVSKFNTRVSFEFTIEFPRAEINENIKKNFRVT